MAEWMPDDPLDQLLGAYLHQDYDVEYPDAWAAVDASIREHSPKVRAAARQELLGILEREDTEDGLSRAVSKLGVAYSPPADGYTYRAWLHEVDQRIRTAGISD